MYVIGDIGRWEKLPILAQAICEGDVQTLTRFLTDGGNINLPITLSEAIALVPLEIAVYRNDVPMIHFLLEHGADFRIVQEQPLLLSALRCCGPEVVQLFIRDVRRLTQKQKERAYQEIRWGGRLDNLSLLEKAGISVARYAGPAFRAAASDGNRGLVTELWQRGVDINYHKPDMVFPYASTPVIEATRSQNFAMVRWLVDHGADITIKDKYGDRPYSVAIKNKNVEMAQYFQALEPEDWHKEEEKLRALQPYKLPARLVTYIQTGPLRIEFPEEKWVKWMEFYAFMDVQTITWKRKKYVSLMANMDQYADYLLLWSPRDQKLWYLDTEHEELRVLACWDDFIAKPGWYLNGMIEGRFV